ncbi:hypothetical protein BD410DRAFT_316586 [Rickenella mellea]|uniref:Amidohydrolase-related domain-containing protein n=1 Tax=Rickenella mellea TaxID=50990 RepID=A0A4Y7Q2X2_9AGAM|nr:hypothetical protein BD410DRAFT_316586 [Rickenella mellea]
MKGSLGNIRNDTDVLSRARTRQRVRIWSNFRLYLLVAVSIAIITVQTRRRGSTSYANAERKQVLEKCKYLKTPPGPPPGFGSRTHSDRFVAGTKPVLLKNAQIWTAARNGTETIYGNVFLDGGIVKAVGYIPPSMLRDREIRVQNVRGSWVTPGLVDLHSHIGVYSAPSLRGASDGNSRKAPILPWLRSIDGLNTHDASYELAMAGGVTTAQILPGSANNIGGQAFVIKLRPTQERSPTSKVVEPPYSLNGTQFDHSLTPRWRHMKHACGENPSRVYSQTRMDSGWYFRDAYNTARKLKESQDAYCSKAEAGNWDNLGTFPEDLQWEALADVLRGKVKLSVHCYEAVDLDGIVRLSHEFEFPVASFHHAGETYLVPDLLKKAWGGAPAIALFASNFRKKREAYRGSEFAPRVLADHGIPVVMKSDHPVVNSRYLMNEAALAHYYGLNPALALASVTSTPAKAAGLGHRLGSIQVGYDADIVVWDSHPLSLGATPTQVYIDGIPQFSDPYTLTKPYPFHVLPETPDFDKEAKEAVEFEGLPPLEPRRRRGNVLFTNVKSIHHKERVGESGESTIKLLFDTDADESRSAMKSVLVRDGNVVCIEDETTNCITVEKENVEIIDLKGGALAPALTSFGSPLGLVEIRLEASTNDGVVPDPLAVNFPSSVPYTVPRAVDGLQFGGRNTLLAYRSGVGSAVTAPVGGGVILGVSTAFSAGALNGQENGAILRKDVALHVAISRTASPSVGTQIALLRRLLFEKRQNLNMSRDSDLALHAFESIRSGTMTLVVHVENADIMATILQLKADYEVEASRKLVLTFAGAAEAHLLARQIAEAGVGVIVSPSRPFPGLWDQRRILPGPPLSRDSAVTKLLAHNVNVAIGVVDEYAARNTRLDIAWASLESNGTMDISTAIALASTNLEKALGLESHLSDDLVAFRGGGVVDLASKVIGIASARRGCVDIF